MRMIPFMSPGERDLFRKYLNNAVHYWEFGGGGSTAWASTTNTIKSIVTIESDKNYAAKLKGDFKNADIRWIDIGPTGAWGAPSDTSKVGVWNLYPNSWLTKSNEPDMVLIDGRFRVACALTVLTKSDTTNNPYVLIHDFNNRPEYHCILLFYKVIETVDTLVVLQKKDSYDNDFAKVLLEKYYMVYS